jgi:four helix bundle protein
LPIAARPKKKHPLPSEKGNEQYLHMKTFRFKSFTIYNDAKAFRRLIRKEISAFPVQERYRLIDQIERAALSIVLNIAEGSAKKSDSEFCRYLEIAIASANEVAAAIDCAHDDGLIQTDSAQKIELQAELLAKRIGTFMKVLRNAVSSKAKKPLSQ